ncbi:MAG TPA: bifunctional [glutamine synthetase] adenylyltransferase/[glutamine synthetase]-adenylyl-L-tyrosine phosphorylase [Acidimicrobiales bacterium]|nr:bifunctional [glutamine synthetase] adenylyltransferase/[glutamine synthetase]-adenylyl-L-tyrosine phosphorylase [Acidimicrobiales bacterium]
MTRPGLHATVERSADPAAVKVALARLTEAYPDEERRLEEDAGLRTALVAVLAASRSLTELCLADPAALDVLADLDRRTSPPSTDDASKDAVRRWKRLELLRIAARDLTAVDDLPAVGRALAAMAADVLERACALAAAQGLAVIGMGKLGGAELNYASDVDVVFVAGDSESGERAARAVLDVARACFRVDVDLRPEGRDGPLVRSLESYEAYWDRWAETWEFQALLKARPVAGDQELGAAFLVAAEKRLWTKPFTAEDLRAVRSMKARAEGELARRGLTDREIKRGRGGIRDIEFAVQLLQLVHGRHDPALRSPNTLEALAELGAAAYVDPDDARDLDHAYRLLRTVEHRLQLVQERQVHALPTDAAAMSRLARVMGYRDSSESTAGEMLAGYLRRQQATVRSIHEHLFFRPLLDALSSRPAAQAPASTGEAPAAGALSAEAIETRLAAFGFTDARRTRQALAELTRGLTRSSRLMQQMLPLLLQWLSESPDPDLGLLGLRVLTTGKHRAGELAVAFRESPEAARRLCVLVGTSRRLTQTLEHHPDLIPALGNPEVFAPRTPEALLEGATTALAWRVDTNERQRGLERFRRREELRIAASDLLELTPPEEEPVVVVGASLTTLAEACLRAALTALEPPLPLAVVAMGRFGGAELSYASDLDVLFVYDGSTNEDFAMAEKTAEAVLAFLSGQTPANRVYPVDADLRPEGKDGPLARSLEGYRSYYERWAQVWERQALLRARPVAGDAEVGGRFLELVKPHVWRDPFPEDDVREIRRMKARIERERIPAGEDPQFHLKLGRGSLSDIEFTAQLLQLRHRVPATGTMAALGALEAAGALTTEDRRVLGEAYRFCERTRNRWFLVKGAPDDALPRTPENLTRLARSLGTTPQDLRESYRRVTRRARQVVERLFYGKTG